MYRMLAVRTVVISSCNLFLFQIKWKIFKIKTKILGRKWLKVSRNIEFHRSNLECKVSVPAESALTRHSTSPVGNVHWKNFAKDTNLLPGNILLTSTSCSADQWNALVAEQLVTNINWYYWYLVIVVMDIAFLAHCSCMRRPPWDWVVLKCQ